MKVRSVSQPGRSERSVRQLSLANPATRNRVGVCDVTAVAMKFATRPNHSKRQNRRAFTLVELLVCIGVLALLASIVLSALIGARESARRTTCQSNLRQLALATQQYVQDNDGAYPPAYTWQQAIYPLVKNDGVFHCPSYPVESHEKMEYSYNDRWLVLWTPKNRLTTGYGRVEANLRDPTNVGLNGDPVMETGDGTVHYGRYVYNASCGGVFGGSTQHAGGGNDSFLDGQVKWYTPEAMAEVECRNGPPPSPYVP